jgi:LacI family transcriptional regulator
MVAIAEHLVTEHHIRDAAFMGGLKRSPDARDRRRAFLEAFEARGGKVAKYNDLEGDWAVASGVAAMKARMALKQPLPRAVVCANDQMAYGVMSVLKVAGYNVPGDVVVTGFDDTPMSLLADPPLTTVRQDTLGMGRAAVRLILESLEHPGGPSQSVALPTKPIIRNSCGCAFAYAETPEKRLAS